LFTYIQDDLKLQLILMIFYSIYFTGENVQILCQYHEWGRRSGKVSGIF